MKQIYSFVRDKRSGKRLGVIVAIGKNKVGFSKCAKHDIFDKKVGLSIAITAIEHPEMFEGRKTPPEFKPLIERMKERSTRAKIFQ